MFSREILAGHLPHLELRDNETHNDGIAAAAAAVCGPGLQFGAAVPSGENIHNRWLVNCQIMWVLMNSRGASTITEGVGSNVSLELLDPITGLSLWDPTNVGEVTADNFCATRIAADTTMAVALTDTRLLGVTTAGGSLLDSSLELIWAWDYNHIESVSGTTKKKMFGAARTTSVIIDGVSPLAYVVFDDARQVDANGQVDRGESNLDMLATRITDAAIKRRLNTETNAANRAQLQRAAKGGRQPTADGFEVLLGDPEQVH